jgi:hypothetical protein
MLSSEINIHNKKKSFVFSFVLFFFLSLINHMSKSQDLLHARQVQSVQKKQNIERKKTVNKKEKFVTRVKEFHM